ncbi:hypothetical protein RB653_010377 [Dictyostelium firmibasis]|uniref:Protein FRA10AC1 n=1 Tax=Dictyostelium firmibasis TaxID=79012 RepID=A0AAN7YPQ8_9MYCE
MEVNKEQYEYLKKLEVVERHKKLIENYLNQKNKKKLDNEKYKDFKTDYQILKENHQFLRDDNDESIDQLTWEEKLAKTYYDRLYKEYAIIDLSRYKSGEIGLRWRIESEVISGRGQFTCSNKKCESSSVNSKSNELKSFEVPFSYSESNENKIALVKVVLCPLCSKLLNYSNIKKKKKELKKFLKEEKIKNKKRKKDNSEDDHDSDSDSSCSSSENDDNSKNERKKKSKKKRKSIQNKERNNIEDEAPKKEKEQEQEKEEKEKNQYEDFFNDMFL